MAYAPPTRAIEQEIVISVYQGPCQQGDFEQNLETVRQIIGKARERSSHFIVFPECFLSGYADPLAVRRGARTLEEPALIKFIAETAQHDIVVILGVARQKGEALYNSALVIHRGRLLGVYDKVMLTAADRQALGFQPGDSVPVFSAHGVKFAINICHDTSFPHAAMMACLQGAEILFTPHYNVMGPESVDAHRRWVRNCHVGLASQFKLAVARANTVTSEDAAQLGYGDSFILSPQGTALAQAKPFATELITAAVTPAMFRSPWVWAELNETPGWLRARLGQQLAEFRRPETDDEMKYWLENMAVYHRFRPDEISAATGMTLAEISAALRQLGLEGAAPRPRGASDPIRILPYPGGRHPRIGFLEGAVMPLRETKFSAFTPWDESSYVVVDVPEAIFSNLGLIYLAHTHVPTIWDARGERLARQEWRRNPDGSLDSQRTLPNGIRFEARIIPTPDHVRMTLALTNGTSQTLTGLRVQNCVMLAGARGFADQTNDNKLFPAPYAAARSSEGNRWVITAWDPIQRSWGNERCPCLHADPQFPDCPPGETVSVRGWLSFYEGDEIERELERIEATGWRKAT
jgi:predicted amidohydrolase